MVLLVASVGLGELLGGLGGLGKLVRAPRSNTLLAALPGGLVGLPARIGLVLESLLRRLVRLGAENVLHQETLVTESVTLDLDVQLVVKVLVNLLSSAVPASYKLFFKIN